MNDLVIYNSSKRITQHYGHKTSSGKIHRGVDLSHSKSEDKNVVYANCSGTIKDVVDKYDNMQGSTGMKSYGNYVLIKHPNGFYSRYAHLRKGSISVKKGQVVNEKTPIGVIGNSGNSYGRHLHFEVMTGYNTGRINPEPYLTRPIYRHTQWEKGTYELLVSKAIRTTPKIENNIVLVKDTKLSVRPKLTSKKPNDKAFFKVGVNVDITDIIVDSANRVWGKLTNTYIVLCNKDGTPQAKRIS